GVGADHAGIAERGAAGRRQRVDDQSLHAGALQVQRRGEADDSGADDDRIGRSVGHAGSGNGVESSVRGVCVSRSGPCSVTSTVSLNDAPAADAYMWNTMVGSSRQLAPGWKTRVKSLVRGVCGA